jgi:glycerate kinase
MRVLVAMDKFRGTATAPEATAAVAGAARRCGCEVDEAPLADGGEGLLDALGGPNRTTTVTGPLGDPVEAPWRFSRGEAVIEMAHASGLALVGGPEGNDAVAAATFGTGELIAAALDAGARRIVVGLGGSATTDGGLGAIRAIGPLGRLRRVELVVACDVRTRFLDAARVFAGQKGATPAQIELLSRRLERLAEVYAAEHGVDVRELESSGAAGGLAGGLAAIGAELVSGFDLVAEEVELAARTEAADAVITGEGFLDPESFDGKVVGGVADLATRAGRPVAAVVGEILDGFAAPITACSLVELVGRERALHDTLAALEEVAGVALAALATEQP